MMSDDVRTAVEAADAQASRDPSLFTASNGLRLKLKRVPQLLVLDATKHLRRPRIPMVMDPAKGREMENPNDPDYLDEVRRFVTTQSITALNIYLTLGVTVLTPLPEGVAPLESDEWSDMIHVVYPELEIPPSGPMRKLIWLKYHAVPDEDLNRVLSAIALLGGAVREEDVQRAQETFRGDTPWDAAARMVVDPEVGYGAGAGAADPGNGSRVGAPGSSGLHALPSDRVVEA